MFALKRHGRSGSFDVQWPHMTEHATTAGDPVLPEAHMHLVTPTEPVTGTGLVGGFVTTTFCGLLVCAPASWASGKAAHSRTIAQLAV